MSLGPGTRLGPYEIQSPLGAGGMGEVYRARDTKLGREVALKVVGDGFANDPERVARFRREAQLLAALNHPHIATIHGLEEADGGQFLVMELVEGETLADRLKSGPLPIDEALRLARQIAEALQAAHEKGIVHRDLKPANIALTAQGEVKVLDFGLAKALGPPEGGPYVPDVGAGFSRPDLTHSPTLSVAATQAGVILGTAAYMSPEQARGKEADKRSDIWAFGCVLYEMLTGTRAFDGEDVALVLASVLKGEPDWSALPSGVRPPVVALLRRCLIKERRERVSDAGVVLFVLDEAGQLAYRNGAPVVAAAPTPTRRLLWRRVLAATAAAMIGAVATAAGLWFWAGPTPPPVVRSTIATAQATALNLGDRDVAITPDGSRIVYRGANQLWVRALDQMEPLALGGLGTPRAPFVSPDGQWIGYFDGNTQLRKVAITGGPPVTITRVDGSGARGATWGADGTIVFATAAPDMGLQRVSAAGGEASVLTRPQRDTGTEGDHLWPEFLPGREAVLFTITPVGGAVENAQIAVLDLRTGTSKVVIRGGSHAQYVASGHLVYGAAGTLRAVRFDLDRLEVIGAPVPVLESVVTTLGGAANVAVSAGGSLAYVSGTNTGGATQTLVSIDREGRTTPLAGIPPDSYRDVKVSPDGARLAIATETDVWTYDLARAALSRLTTDPAPDTRPMWTPDGQRIVFTSIRGGYRELFRRQADGTGTDERLLSRAKDLVDLRAMGWSPDGTQLLITEVSAGTAVANRCVIGQTPAERPGDVKLLVANEFCSDFPALSPDGRWMAYNANISGRFEVYVERYPDLGSRQQISTGGGRCPVWSDDGRELFFSSPEGGQLFAVPVRQGTTLQIGQPKMLFEINLRAVGGGTRLYDIAPDGRFFAIQAGQTEGGAGPATQLVLIQNWLEELKRLVPTN